MESVGKIVQILLRGFVLTLELAGVTVVVAVLLGAALAMVSFSRFLAVRFAAKFFSWLIRGIPPLVLLLGAYYGLFYAGLDLSPFVSATIALSISHAAYFMENIRGGILALPKGQVEAGRALGMSRTRIAWRVELPELLRIIRPTCLASTTTLVKNTSVASIVAVGELMSVANKQVAVTGEPFLVLAIAGLFYFVACSVLLLLGRGSSR
jgi:polar amino acid transport system permease protein